MSAMAWVREHWKPIAIVTAGAAGLWLLMQRQGSSAPAGAAASLPAMGPPPSGDQTPPPQYFSDAEHVAANLSHSELFRQALQAQSAANLYGATPAGADAHGHQKYSYGTGQVSKAWQQVVINGQQMWEDIYHPGHVITEQQAQQLAPQDHGPYASGAGKLTLGNILRSVAGSVFGLAATGSPITLGNLFRPPTAPKPSGARPSFTPGIAPTPSFRGTPAAYIPGEITEVH